MNCKTFIPRAVWTGVRRGSLMIEILVCGALLAVLLATAIPTMSWVLRQRKLCDQREAALLEVDNLMERVTAVEWSELTTDRAAQFRLSDPVAAQLPDSRLEIAVETDPDDPLAKIVQIRLTWDNGPGRLAPPVRLTAWVYRREANADSKE
jgi:Tfp pilus assembly protein PilE